MAIGSHKLLASTKAGMHLKIRWGKKSDTKECLLCQSTFYCYEMPEDAGLWGYRTNQWLPRVEGRLVDVMRKPSGHLAHHLVCDRAFTGVFYMSKHQIVFFVYYIL